MAVTPFCPHPAMQTLVANAIYFFFLFKQFAAREKAPYKGMGSFSLLFLCMWVKSRLY